MVQKRMWIFLLAVILSACSGAAPTSEQALVQTPVLVTEAPVIEAVSTSGVAGTAVAADAPIEPTPTEELQKEIATDFQPTDASMIQLGDGKPKLVEFFAFW
jgi:hypothetical protein